MAIRGTIWITQTCWYIRDQTMRCTIYSKVLMAFLTPTLSRDSPSVTVDIMMQGIDDSGSTLIVDNEMISYMVVI